MSSIVLGRSEAGYPHDNIDSTRRCWIFALDLAEIYGWVPAGTQPTQWTGKDWDRTIYDVGDGQYVTPDDACALAGALEKALGAPELVEHICGFAVEKWEASSGCSPAEAANACGFSNINACRRFLNALVEFCKRGGFWIS